MRPSTLAEACERVRLGEPPEKAFSEVWDQFYRAADAAAKLRIIADCPGPTGDIRLDAYVAAASDYLARRAGLWPIPEWVFDPARILKEPWFTTKSRDPGMLEFLTFSSPGEFKQRNIFTEEAPLRRASG